MGSEGELGLGRCQARSFAVLDVRERQWETSVVSSGHKQTSHALDCIIDHLPCSDRFVESCILDVLVEAT